MDVYLQPMAEEAYLLPFTNSPSNAVELAVVALNDLPSDVLDSDSTDDFGISSNLPISSDSSEIGDFGDFDGGFPKMDPAAFHRISTPELDSLFDGEGVIEPEDFKSPAPHPARTSPTGQSESPDQTIKPTAAALGPVQPPEGDCEGAATTPQATADLNSFHPPNGDAETPKPATGPQGLPVVNESGSPIFSGDITAPRSRDDLRAAVPRSDAATVASPVMIDLTHDGDDSEDATSPIGDHGASPASDPLGAPKTVTYIDLTVDDEITRADLDATDPDKNKSESDRWSVRRLRLRLPCPASSGPSRTSFRKRASKARRSRWGKTAPESANSAPPAGKGLPDGLDAKPEQAFAYFPHLPPEIQLNIWEKAAASPRVVKLRFTDGPLASGKPHPLLSACSASRCTYLKFSDRFVLVDDEIVPTISPTPELAVNFSEDLFYIRDYEHTQQDVRLRFSGVLSMKKIMVCNEWVFNSIEHSPLPELWVYLGQGEPEFTQPPPESDFKLRYLNHRRHRKCRKRECPSCQLQCDVFCAGGHWADWFEDCRDLTFHRSIPEWPTLGQLRHAKFPIVRWVLNRLADWHSGKIDGHWFRAAGYPTETELATGQGYGSGSTSNASSSLVETQR